MEMTSTAGANGENLDPQSGELARLLVELVRAGYTFTFQVVPNEWGVMTNAEIVFERAMKSESARTVQAEIEAVKEGMAPKAPIHWRFDPFEPVSLFKAIKRFHQLFVEKALE